MTLRLYNTLTRRKEDFRPLDPGNVRMYVCGPTVYDFAHIGNARPVVVFDVLFRLLRQLYPRVTYVRNITDVDDKINARAARDFPDLPLNEAIGRVTEGTLRQFHADVAALNCLEPTVEPRATGHIDDMKAMIERLVEKDCAYVTKGHVLFHVAAMPDYGVLANRSLDEMLAGARVEVAPYKRDAMDFVLWKPSSPGEPAWESPCGIETPGRPGWHIECSAMARKHLGDTFDIHGGGIDLMFPHHENELAQSRCALGVDRMASVWMHNGFLQVEGRKMAKSEGNFVTIHDLLNTSHFGGRPWRGPVLRLAMLRTHYSQPLDWTVESLNWAEETHSKWTSFAAQRTTKTPDKELQREFNKFLLDDLNTPGAFSVIERVVSATVPTEGQTAFVFSALKLLGFKSPPNKTKRAADLLARASQMLSEMELSEVRRIAERVRWNPIYKNGQLRPETKLIATVRFLQQVIESRGFDRLEFGAKLDELYRTSLSQVDVSTIERLKNARSAARSARDWSEADRIRDELATMGIVLHDTKDPETGEPVTEWEVKA